MSTIYYRRRAEFSWIWTRDDIERRLNREFPYPCPVSEECGERFSTRSALTRHRRKRGHWGYFRYAPLINPSDVTCSICGYVPWDLADNPKHCFRNHQRRKHKIWVKFYKIREYP